MTIKNTFRLLHISDLHIKDSEEDKFDRGVVLDPLIERVKEDRERGLRPEIVVVTGDVAFQGIESEYKLAKKFFSDLLGAMELSDKKLFIVPGNHDVNRKKYPKSVGIPVYKNMSELNKEIEDEDDRSFLLAGMEGYFTFIEDNYAHLKTMHDRLVPFVHVHKAGCGKRIGLVGLNSAWMCRKSPDEREIAIGEFQVKTAIEELKEKGKVDLQICLFHHPLNWLLSEDRDISRKYLNGTVVLSGHLHDSVGGYFHDQDGEIHQFIAGGAYIGSDSDWPCRYQYITFDWDESKIRVDYRKFVKQRRIWCVESEKGEDGKADFNMPGTGERPTPESPRTTPGDEDEVFKPYLQAALNEHRHLPTQGFETTLRVPIELERVYINMRANLSSILTAKKECRRRCVWETCPPWI
jgi:predicted phosphodiesterase